MTGGAGRARPSELDHPLSLLNPLARLKMADVSGFVFCQKPFERHKFPFPEQRGLIILLPTAVPYRAVFLHQKGFAGPVLLILRDGAFTNPLHCALLCSASCFLISLKMSSEAPFTALDIARWLQRP